MSIATINQVERVVSHWDFVSEMGRLGPVRMEALAKVLGWPRPTAYVSLRRLLTAGLVERTEPHLYGLTPVARRILEGIRPLL